MLILQPSSWYANVSWRPKAFNGIFVIETLLHTPMAFTAVEVSFVDKFPKRYSFLASVMSQDE